MLYEFLDSNRIEILSLAEEKTVKLAGRLSTSDELERGLPLFYENVISYLKASNPSTERADITRDAAKHGQELLRLQYSLSHVVHSYGAICQAITEYAQRRTAHITATEFNDLNMCLDVAIASAVSEFQFRSVQASEAKEVQHLGALVHELRNALSSATVAQDMMTKGLVGTGGSTSKVLSENLRTMRNLIDRSLSEVRMRADPELSIEAFSLNALVDQIIFTAVNDAGKKFQLLQNEIKAQISIETDRQLLLSALANLIQNAIKYSKEHGSISVGARVAGENVVIEVVDECGGIATAVLNSMFTPFISGPTDPSGLGLGLTIVRRATSMLGGQVSVTNNPGVGCAFLVTIPKKLTPISQPKSVSGEASVHPKRATKS